MVRKSVKRAYILAIFIMFLAVSTGFSGPLWALDAMPVYEPVSIGALIRDAYPTAGISSAVALNEQIDTVGRVIIDSQYHAFVYTGAHGVHLLPALEGFTSHVAADITDRDPSGQVLIVGAAQSSIYSDPERAVAWVYDALNGVVVETVDIGNLPGTDMSTATAVNNKGLVVGYSRASSWLSPYQPMVFDFRSRILYDLAIPFNPVDVNNLDVITGGTYRAQLVDDGSTIGVGTVEDLSTTEEPGVSRTTALNDMNEVVGVTSMGYTDGSGRMVTGAVRYMDGTGWEVLWANSAYDTAEGIDSDGDVVGSIGISAAIRPFLYIEALKAGYLINDLIDPSFSGVNADYAAYDINDAGDIAAGASGAVLFIRTGDMPSPTPPANLTAVPHYPTWQQPWNAITLNWENTSSLTVSYSVERSLSGTNDWIEIESNWVNTQLWDTDVGLGVTYDYRVRAEGIAGFSDYSDTATATAPGDPVDSIAPEGTIISPADGAEVSGNVQIVVEASDNSGLSYVEIRYSPSMGSSDICTEVLNSAQTATVTCTWRARKIDPGNYSITATTVDDMGNYSVDSVSVTLTEQSKGGGGGKGKGGK